MRQFVTIAKKQFERFLSKYNYCEFTSRLYSFDWVKDRTGRFVKKNKPIMECCYLIVATRNRGIKVYSGIDRKTKKSREKGRDSIKLVACEIIMSQGIVADLPPVRARFTHRQRIDTWQENLTEGIAEVLESLKQ